MRGSGRKSRRLLRSAEGGDLDWIATILNIYLSRVTYFLSIYPGLNGYTLYVLGFLDLQTEIDMLYRLVDNTRAKDINFYKKRNIQGQGTLQ